MLGGGIGQVCRNQINLLSVSSMQPTLLPKYLHVFLSSKLHRFRIFDTADVDHGN
jgi:hypothetical protein